MTLYHKKKALKIEILHFCSPCGFPCKEQNIELEKLAERSYLSILTLIEKIQPLIVEEIGFFFQRRPSQLLRISVQGIRMKISKERSTSQQISFDTLV